jgi:DNA-binding NtrC family response regulator
LRSNSGVMTTILLVEDDPLQAFVRMSALEKRFPEVRRVADAAEALCLIEDRVFADNLGLVIAGNHLPGLGGPEFVAELHARIPGVPVLVLGDGFETANDYSGQDIRFLSRPIGAQDVAEAASQMVIQDGHKVA